MLRMTIAGKRLDKALGVIAGPLKRLGTAYGGLFLTGGAVRDVLLGKLVHDVDVTVTKGSPVSTGRAFADAAGGALAVLGREKLVRVYLKTATVDFTPLRDRTLELDLRRRDFTVNAMAVRIPWGPHSVVEDPLGGCGHLKARRLTLCRPQAFREDPVRLWRAHRAEVELGLRPDSSTSRHLRADAFRTGACSAERLRDELFKLLTLPRAAKALRAAAKSGVLEATFPQLLPMRRVRVPRGGWIHVLNHTLEALEHLERFLGRVRAMYRQEGQEMTGHFSQEPVSGRSRLALLKLALLLHDIAKPETISRNAKGDVHFYKHELIGARRAAGLLRKQLKCAEVEVSIVTRVIQHHLRLGHLAAAGRFTDRATYRFLRDAGEELFELILHAQADRCATHHGGAVTAYKQHRTIARILAFRRAMREHMPVKRLITGHDLMQEFDLKPGPVIGKLLQAVEEGVALGKIRSRTQALRAARAVLDRNKGRVL